MPQYVISAIHPPDQCPTANSKTRALMLKIGPELPGLAQRLGVKIVFGPLVLGAEHENITVVDAASIESVRDFVNQSGLVQWNSVKISPSQTMEEALADLDKVPPPLY